MDEERNHTRADLTLLPSHPLRFKNLRKLFLSEEWLFQMTAKSRKENCQNLVEHSSFIKAELRRHLSFGCYRAPFTMEKIVGSSVYSLCNVNDPVEIYKNM